MLFSSLFRTVWILEWNAAVKHSRINRECIFVFLHPYGQSVLGRRRAIRTCTRLYPTASTSLVEHVSLLRDERTVETNLKYIGRFGLGWDGLTSCLPQTGKREALPIRLKVCVFSEGVYSRVTKPLL